MTDDADDRPEPGSPAADAAVADQLADAIEALRQVDLNYLLDPEIRTVLDTKEALTEVCLDRRQNQHAGERNREQRE